jgi:Bacterial type III secretion protein (HrpB1_HrpK)
MTIPQWPPGTFGWLAQVFNVAAGAKLVAEGQAIIELICAVAPQYRGRALLEGLLLHHTERYQEASELLADVVNADPGYVYARYALYQSLWALDSPEWVQHAQVLAAAGHEELSPMARAKLAEAGRADDTAAGTPEKADEATTLATRAFHNMLVRV